MLLYDTLTKTKQDIADAFNKKPGETIKLYTCGPTVYHFAHIGNLRTYVWQDVLERTLALAGYKVDRVMNITDVGHLTSDADEGEDKMDKALARENKSIEDIILFYTAAFLKDCERLNIRIPEKLPRASHHIEAQQELIAILFQKDLAYDTPEAVYFDTSKFPAYGALSGQKVEDKAVGVRDEVVTETSKRHPADFALWFKLTGRFETHAQHWPSPWGEGFPGWHIECSALIHELLGEPIDIHTGGVDHIGTHHTNEIAQSEGAFGAPFTKLWMHGEHLLVGEGKMAKSGSNAYILETIIERNIDPLALRYLSLGAHYRTKLNFTWESLEAAARGLDKLRHAYLGLRGEDRGEAGGELPREAIPYLHGFRAALFDDLNTPQALAVAYKTLDSGLDAGAKRMLLETYDREALGLGFQTFAARYDSVEIPQTVRLLAEEREEARKNRDFNRSDELRSEIEAHGYILKDTPQGPQIRPR